jgi:ketosteroid isomerase-like protein
MVLVPVLIALLVQTPSKAADAENEQFQALETQVSGAIQIKNVAALEQLLAKDFAFSLFLAGRAPEVMNRDEWLKAAAYYTLTGFEIRYLSVRVFGNVAAVRLQPNRKATAGTTLDRSGEFAVVDIWTKDGNAWKLSSRYLSRPDTIKR